MYDIITMFLINKIKDYININYNNILKAKIDMNNKDVLLIIINNYPEYVKYSKTIVSDYNIARYLINKCGLLVDHIDSKILDTKLCIDAIENNPYSIFNIPSNKINDIIFYKAVSYGNEFILPELYKNYCIEPLLKHSDYGRCSKCNIFTNTKFKCNHIICNNCFEDYIKYNIPICSVCRSPIFTIKGPYI